MDGHIVGDLVQLVHVLHHVDVAVQAQGGVHRQEGVIAIHVHAQVQGHVAHQRADGAQADDTQGLLIELGAHKGGLALLHRGGHVHALGVGLLLYPLGAAHDVAGGDEHGGDDQLLHGVGVGAGGVEDHDAVLGAAVNGDIVGAGAGAGDGPQGLGELILVHGGGADQDAVLVLYVVAHLKAGLVQMGQTGAGDLIQSLDAIHNKNPLYVMAGPVLL